MSTAINVYALPLGTLQQAVGSGDSSLLDAIMEEQAEFLESIDAIDEDAEATCADALAELVHGEVSEDVPGYLYGYALQALCAHLGETLPNICPIAGASEWIGKVDGVLEGMGIPLRLSMLVQGGSPVAIPEPEDYPFIGMWQAEGIAAALAGFRGLAMGSLESEMAETLGQLRGWVEAAAGTRGSSLIGFLC